MKTTITIKEHEAIVEHTIEQRNVLKNALEQAYRILKAMQEDNVLDSDGQEYVENWHMEIIKKALIVY